jgi:endonuclease I
MNKNSLLLFTFIFLFAFSLFSQIPVNYYNNANGKSNAELKTALHQIIEVGTRLSYGSGSGSTWSGFEKSDLHPNGTVWDMYSLERRYFTGNATAPSGMNIEHSVAKSWWGGSNNNAYKDLYHLNPSDATANSARGSYPLGTTDGGSFNNGSIKVGKNTFSTDYTDFCFEPLDEYKGDFARAYLYMFTCYEDFSWTGTSAPTMLVANQTWPMLKTWAKNLLVSWHRQDPVSEKERVRMAEIFKLQNNRNPYIDYPELVEYLWGTRQGQPWNADGGTYPYLTSPTSSTTINFGKIPYLQTAHSTIQIKAQHLTGDLSIAISGTNNTNFSLSKTTLTKVEAEAGFELSITYSAQNVGNETAVLTISGGGITPVNVNISATSSDDFMALNATEIRSDGFRANWTVSAFANGYLLNVYTLQNTGNTQPTTMLEEGFSSALSGGWTSEGYTDNATAGAIRLASGSNPGRITTPALDFTKAGNKLTVKARQYSNDTGAKLTAIIDNEALAVFTTTATNQDFTIEIPVRNADSKITLSANAGSRVYVDNLKIETQANVQSVVSQSGYPRLIGNVLNYTVSSLQADSVYYYTLTPQGNNALSSNPVKVRTAIVSDVKNIDSETFSYTISPLGIHLSDVSQHSIVRIFDIRGIRIFERSVQSTELQIPLERKGMYLMQIQQDQKMKSIKILF